MKNIEEEENSFLNKYLIEPKDKIFVTTINKKKLNRWEMDFLMNDTIQ